MPRIRPSHPKVAKERRFQTANRDIVEHPLPDPVGAKRPTHRTVSVNLSICPIDWLHNRGYLDQRQYDAGERLRGDFEMAGLAPSVTMRWDEAVDKGLPLAQDLHRSEASLSAKRRFFEAVSQAGPGLDSILWRVVCVGESVPEAERALGWPARGGRLVLTLALDRVADYYRIGAPRLGETLV